MTWVINYKAPKGFRVNRYFDSVTTHRISDDQKNVWFYDAYNVWSVDAPVDDYKGCMSTHHSRHSPKSYKAFKRYLNKHPELKGYEVVLVNRFYNTLKTGERIHLHLSALWQD